MVKTTFKWTQGRHCLAKHCCVRWRRHGGGMGEVKVKTGTHRHISSDIYTDFLCNISKQYFFFSGGTKTLCWFYSPAGGQGSNGVHLRFVQACHHYRKRLLESAHLFHLMTRLTFLFPPALTHSSLSLVFPALSLLTLSRHSALIYIFPIPT